MGYKLIFDPGLAAEHYSRRLIDNWAQNNPGFKLDMNINNTYVLLKHLSWAGKLIFLPYTFLIGDGGCPGLLRYLLIILRRPGKRMRYREMKNALRGKLTGIGLWLEFLSTAKQ
jgi:hypothetical protein